MFHHSVPFEGVCSGEKIMNMIFCSAFVFFTSVLLAELAVEGSHQFAVPRCLMGADSSPEVFAPNRRAPGTHQEGNQLIHT